MIVHQDKEIILLEDYEYTGQADGIYLKKHHYSWMMSTIGNLYRVLLRRSDRNLIYIENEYYIDRYTAIATSLSGDVLILGMGVAILDPLFVVSPFTDIKWVERNDWLVSNIFPTEGTVHQGDAEDMDFLTGLGTFDTVLIDFTQTKENDYSPLLNPGGTIIEMKL